MTTKVSKDYLYNKYLDLFSFADEAVYKAPSILLEKKVDSLAKGITLYHYVRAIYLTASIKILCSEGYATEANVLLRSLLNLFINIKWLTSEDVASRMKKFADSEIAYRNKIKNSLKKHSTLINNIIDEDFEVIKGKYDVRNGFSGKNIAERAKDVSLEKEYFFVFKKLSDLDHTGPAAVSDYLDCSDDEGIINLYVGPKNKNITLVLNTALVYFFRVKAITHTVFELDMADLQKDKKILNRLTNKYSKYNLCN